MWYLGIIFGSIIIGMVVTVIFRLVKIFIGEVKRSSKYDNF